MKSLLNLIAFNESPIESRKSHRFEYLNRFYKDHVLQFDQYGNPIFLSE